MTEQTTKIIEVEDVLARARDLIECASSAAAHVLGKEADQVSTALEVAGEKIGEAIALLGEYREPERTQAFEEAKARMEAAPWNFCLKGVEE